MGTATFTITDMETGTSVVLRMDDSGLDIYGGDTDSPPPSTYPTTLKRAIVIHAIPQLDYNVGQDMGLDELRATVGGICQKAIRDQLIAWLAVPQFTTVHPAGRFSISSVRRDYTTDSSVANAALEALVHSPLTGSYLWYKVTLQFVQVSPSQ